MSSTSNIRNVYFILKSLEIADIFQRFSVFLKIENYDFLKMGDFVCSDLPSGLKFPVILEDSWFKNPEIELEIRTNGHTYAGILMIGKPENQNFSISGTTTVYRIREPADHISLECTILVEEFSSKILEKSEILEEKKIGITRETQTERAKKLVQRDGETQFPSFVSLRIARFLSHSSPHSTRISANFGPDTIDYRTPAGKV
ncbi:Protein CBG11700 [Caenorhabditis briggsae]|uniref:Protein CBG11700 n=1 Tax=Caenorhabditis briggsae TaxID=6238 RepID=A8XDX7_CAEBR|nr:Protein CBG11700 [Caenorhabditis briggsae]CAP30872.1 Protein CBG11700 [Caenorhabditis briggsae]